MLFKHMHYVTAHLMVFVGSSVFSLLAKRKGETVGRVIQYDLHYKPLTELPKTL